MINNDHLNFAWRRCGESVFRRIFADCLNLKLRFKTRRLKMVRSTGLEPVTPCMSCKNINSESKLLAQSYLVEITKNYQAKLSRILRCLGVISGHYWAYFATECVAIVALDNRLTRGLLFSAKKCASKSIISHIFQNSNHLEGARNGNH